MKTKNSSSKKKTEKKKVVKKTTKKSKTLSVNNRLINLEKKQDQIITLLKEVLKDEEEELKFEEKEIKDEEKEIALEKEQLTNETLFEAEEQEELSELKKIESLEKEIEKDVGPNPLQKITIRDITKSAIGAFFGVVGHFAFAEGIVIAEHLDPARTILLFITSFLIIITFLYFTGFRKVNDHFVFKVLPIRAIAIYITSLVTIFIVLLLFGEISFSMSFMEIINAIAINSILAVIGACTADLIGKNGE